MKPLLFTDMQDRNRRQNQLDHDLLNRRHFMGRALWGIGASALSHLLPQSLLGSGVSKAGVAPRAKSVIYLFMSGAPSQLDLYDHKPQMEKWFDKDLPESIRQGQRLTTMTSGQSRFPIAPSMYAFGLTVRVAPHSRSSCPTPPRWWTNWLSYAVCTPMPSTTIRPSP